MTLQELMDRNYEQGLEQGRAEGEAFGLEKGRAEGEAFGLEKGRAEGEAFGKEQMRFEMARSMKEDGEDAERIAKYTGIPTDEIKKL